MWLPIEGPPLDSIKLAAARQNIWHGPIRSGKTVSSLLAWVIFASTQAPPGDLFMVGKTELTLARNTLDPLAQFLGSNFHYSLGQHKAWLRNVDTGKWRGIHLIGANDQRAEGKIRGATAAGVYGDELTLWPESFYRQMLGRMSVRGARLFGTTNPDGPYHWLKSGFLDRADELDLQSFSWPIDVNTMLDPEYVEKLKAEYVPGSLWHKRFIEGLWVAAEGAVYDFFNEAEHVVPALPERAPDQVDLSIDYGTSNATSAGAYASWNRVPPGQLRTVRIGGYYHDGRATGRQKTDREYANEITDWASALGRNVRYVFLDPSAASFGQELRRQGLRVRPATNDVIDGIRTQAKMLRAGEYRILDDPTNRPCIRDYGAYLWDAKAQERGEDKPLKQNDHCFVAGTMVTTRRGAIPIDNVTTRDEVLTRTGYRKVLKAGMTRRQAPVMRAEFSNGAALVATPNHPVFVQGHGFVRMDALRYADATITVWDARKPARTTVAHTGAIPTRVTSPTAGTSERQAAQASSTATSGKTTTAQSPKATRSTTSTATPRTTPSRIWRACLAAATSAFTELSARWKAITSTPCSPAQQNGTRPMPAGAGMLSTPSGPGAIASRPSGRASSAEAPTSRSPVAMLTDSAPTPARPQREGPPAWTTKHEHALTAAPSSLPTSTARFGIAHVLAAPQPHGRADVYDLTVDGLPEFVANGILVHNSKDEERYYLHTVFGRITTDQPTAEAIYR